MIGLRQGAKIALFFASTSIFAIGAHAADLPTGGQITAGSGSISQNGNTMNITQDSAKMVADWQSFSIGAGNTVNFIQPSSDAVALNRVLGSDVSVIQGALNANGKVFLINPNGVTFSKDAQVNVGGLVASTHQITTEDFLAGNYKFEGQGSNAVINQGNITAHDGGTVALIAAKIVNEGTIIADGGNVFMGAGEVVTLDLGGVVNLEVNKGALETVIEQGGAIRADGGFVYLTAKAAGDLATSVINHTGITEAKTLSTGKTGKIVLLGDMDVGTTKVAGELNATAPAGGDGGFIETSAANVDIAQGTKITAGSALGQGGLWLIDPFDYIIDATAAGNIAGTLNTGTSVTVQTTVNNASFGSTGSGTNGNIKVASAINKTAGGAATLTLEAENVIDLAADITSTAGALNLNLFADSDANGSGVIIATKGVSLGGGNLSFGDGTTATLNGQNVRVGGDVYVGGTDQVVFQTGGGNIDVFGELIIANPEGVKFITNNGDAHFYEIINSGNKYEKITSPLMTWDYAYNDAKNGTAGLDAIGDQYLATVTSRLENSVVVYTGGFVSGAALAQGGWLGGKRVEGIGTDTTWRWVTGPESLEDNGNGLAFSLGAVGNAPINGSFINWQPNEPNGNIGGENRLQIGDALGRWNDLTNDNVRLGIYIRETNYDTADLEIDAGTGTVTFDKSIGGLKGINYTAYDASNPKPSTPAAATDTSVPKNSAVATAQSSASGTAGSASTTVTTPTISGGSTPNIGGAGGTLTVGAMTIVQVRSGGSGSAGGSSSGGGGASSGGSSSSSSGQGGSDQQQASEQGGEDFDFASLGDQGDMMGQTKVFVIDGGVKLPAGQSNDEE